MSPLRIRLEALRRQFPAPGAEQLEDWLVDVANARGARIVIREQRAACQWTAPSLAQFSNEELVVAICQPHCLDRPQMLRLAAQLISRGAVEFARLRLIAERERAGVVLGGLAREALRVAPDHPLWRKLAAAFPRLPAEPLLHWTRLADPVMRNGRCNAESWRLVA